MGRCRRPLLTGSTDEHIGDCIQWFNLLIPARPSQRGTFVNWVFPVKVNIDSGGKPNGIPERSGGGSAGIWGAGERGPCFLHRTSYLFGLILTCMADSDRPGTRLTS